MTKRAHINKDTKIASLLLEVWHLRGRGIPYAEAKMLTAGQICSLAEWHHSTPHAIGGSIHPINLTAMPILEHRKRTREIDVPAIAKGKRIRRKQEQHLTRMTEKLTSVDVTGAKADGPRRQPMAGSRNSPWRRRMSGKVERR